MKLRIKEVIKLKGYSVKGLAEKMNINRVNLTNMINGNPTVETLGKIADALEVPVTDLFEKEDDPEKKEYINILCPHCGKSVPVKIEAITEDKE